MKDSTFNNFFFTKAPFYSLPEDADGPEWIEHLPFAFWITEILCPEMIVEIGAGNGVSYFSFCQAVKKLNLPTTCFGIDTWQEGISPDFEKDKVFNQMMGFNTREYSRFSTLTKSTVNAASSHFTDGSIDLLHINGRYSYEELKGYLEIWLPKLSKDAVILLHKINLQEEQVGTGKLWKELKTKYLYFQFDFGYGPGIIMPGNIGAEVIKLLTNPYEDGGFFLFLTENFAERGSSFKNKLMNNTQLLKEEGLIHDNNLTFQDPSIKENYAALLTNYEKLKDEYNILKNENEQYQNDVIGLSRRLRHVKAQIRKKVKEKQLQKKNISRLNEIIDSNRKVMGWYKATYESRGILGVLKDKIALKFKKNRHTQIVENTPSSFHTVNYIHITQKTIGFFQSSLKKGNEVYNLQLNQIIIAEDGRQYVAIGTDPFFIINLNSGSLKAGWYHLVIKIAAVKGVLLSPMLYFDYGFGFNEQDIWNLPSPINDEINCLINFSSKALRLRFDPAKTTCTFTIKDFSLQALGFFKTARIGAAKYKDLYMADKSQLSFYYSFLMSCFKPGKNSLRAKIREGIYYNKIQTWDKYKTWCSLYDTISPDDFNSIKLLSGQLVYKPVFSIIMPVYNPPITFLKKAIDSVLNQAYTHWELCIADDLSDNQHVKNLLKEYQENDNRIKIVFREMNGHISHASNSALSVASGEFIILLDQDDELLPHALYMVADCLNGNKNAGIIYSDEDKIDEAGNRYDPYFKTDWNADLFYGQNMISHLGVYNHALVTKVGGFREGYEGSQDYDLALRCIEHLSPDQILHIPHILYHWRATQGSTAVMASNKNYALDAGLRALKDHFKRTCKQATPLINVNNSFRIKWALPQELPLVTIIIPTKDKVSILANCVESLFLKTAYKNFEVIIVDNNSEDPLTHAYYQKIKAENQQLSVLEFKPAFNFSAMNNLGVKHSKGEILILLNNDTSVINADWLNEMVGLCVRKETGAVGAKLFYPNGLVQHAGVFLFEGNPGNHIYLHCMHNEPGYFNKLNLVQNYSAVTAACLAVRKEVYIAAGGLDEENLKITYNDVDFCLKLIELGYQNVWTPFAQLVHYESLSRGNDLDEANLPRFKKEQSYMLKKWAGIIKNDPFYNPNLGTETKTTTFAFPPKQRYKWRNSNDET